MSENFPNKFSLRIDKYRFILRGWHIDRFEYLSNKIFYAGNVFIGINLIDQILPIRAAKNKLNVPCLVCRYKPHTSIKRIRSLSPAPLNNSNILKIS